MIINVPRVPVFDVSSLVSNPQVPHASQCPRPSFIHSRKNKWYSARKAEIDVYLDPATHLVTHSSLVCY